MNFVWTDVYYRAVKDMARAAANQPTSAELIAATHEMLDKENEYTILLSFVDSRTGNIYFDELGEEDKNVLLYASGVRFVCDMGEYWGTVYGIPVFGTREVANRAIHPPVLCGSKCPYCGVTNQPIRSVTNTDDANCPTCGGWR